MNTEQALLIHLIEECAEVQQRATKALRFGPQETQVGQSVNNQKRLENELIDLLSLIQIMQEDEIIDLPEVEIPYNLTRAERHKVEKYLAYSRGLGIVEK